MTRRKRFRDEGGAGRPLATEAEAEQHADDRELQRGLREAAGGGEDGIDQHRGHERALAADAVGDDAERDAADCRSEQRHRRQQAGGRERQVERRILDERRDHHRVEHHIERIEHPAE